VEKKNRGLKGTKKIEKERAIQRYENVWRDTFKLSTVFSLKADTLLL
jgi:hypothetical protein